MSLHIVGAENLAQDQAVEVIVKFGRDKQPPYTPPTPKTIEITENGEHNVKGYDVADVNVPGIEPTGTLDITANANNIDVAQYAAVNVNVPSQTIGEAEFKISNNTGSAITVRLHQINNGRLALTAVNVNAHAERTIKCAQNINNASCSAWVSITKSTGNVLALASDAEDGQVIQIGEATTAVYYNIIGTSSYPSPHVVWGPEGGGR